MDPNGYACAKCHRAFIKLDEYTSHRLECAKDKEAANSSLHMLGVIEAPESIELRKKILTFEKKRDEDFRRGKF